MPYLAATLLTAFALLALGPTGLDGAPMVIAQAALPDKEKRANCRKACDEALAQLRRTPARHERDQADKDALEKKITALIAENRGRGVDDCVTWTQVMGLAFAQ